MHGFKILHAKTVIYKFSFLQGLLEAGICSVLPVYPLRMVLKIVLYSLKTDPLGCMSWWKKCLDYVSPVNDSAISANSCLKVVLLDSELFRVTQFYNAWSGSTFFCKSLLYKMRRICVIRRPWALRMSYSTLGKSVSNVSFKWVSLVLRQNSVGRFRFWPHFYIPVSFWSHSEDHWYIYSKCYVCRQRRG